MIKYKDWPMWVRITTSFSNKIWYTKSSTQVKSIAYISLIYFVFLLFGLDENNIDKTIGSLILTIFAFISAYSVDWIVNHSSWEERFKNTSFTNE